MLSAIAGDLRDDLRDGLRDGLPGVAAGGEGRWFLGIDLGTTAITMVLRDRGAGRSYPLYWRGPNDEQRFRLPVAAWLPEEWAAARSLADARVRRWLMAEIPVGFSALDRAADQAAGLLLQHFVLELQDALPWTVPGTADLEPTVVPDGDRAIAFHWLTRSLVCLLAAPLRAGGSWTIAAAGLEEDNRAIADALGNLAGVALTEPVSATAAYRFNVREAVIAAGLVLRPEQVSFVAEPLAALVSWLDGAASPETAAAIESGAVLSVRAGASHVGFALAAGRLSHRVALRGFACGGRAIADDVVAQLLCPTVADRAAFGLADAIAPEPGQDDRAQRRQWRTSLARSSQGQALAGTAERLKVQLQGIANFDVGLALGDRTWRISPQAWQEKTLAPWLERFNGELNQLLGSCGIAPERIDRVLCSGGTGAIDPVARWLRQKLPWAQIESEPPLDFEASASCRAADGAARWGELPALLLPAPEPYDDYFLFSELLRTVPETPIAIAQLWRQLDARGINTRGCGERLQQCLAGAIPPGLVPALDDGSAIAMASRQRPDYAQLREQSPFQTDDGGQTYRRDRDRSFHWQRYLSSLWSRGHQGMVEPIADCPEPPQRVTADR